MSKQILSSILVLIFFVSCENRYRRGGVSKQSSVAVNKQFLGKINEDAYQVSQSEYDENFVSRYGLLYLKSSDQPFSGRILTVDVGESGEFVSADESWMDGRKHGKSSKWFSNGIKMYERNYLQGRWHGSVTRWWPNGQKMYVRAYTNGVRHGKEATWRSDGTPLSLPADVGSAEIDSEDASEDEINVNLPAESDISKPESEDSFFEEDPVPATELPSFDNFSAPVEDADMEDSSDDFGDLPSFPVLDEGASETVNFSNEIPESTGPNEGTVDLPLDDPSSLDSLPPMVEEDSSELPDLPGLEDSSELPVTDDLPPLGLPAEDAGGLPPLPGMEDEGELPQLPSQDGGLGDLPPLPPLP
jgi:antitoxin component YwqK of YwqJK toxin-antitoxin module